MSFLVSVAPLAATCFVFPTGPPESAKLAMFFFIHTSHSPILFFRSSALVLAIIFCISAISIRYKTRNFFMGFLFLWLLKCPSLYAVECGINDPRIRDLLRTQLVECCDCRVKLCPELVVSRDVLKAIEQC